MNDQCIRCPLGNPLGKNRDIIASTKVKCGMIPEENGMSEGKRNTGSARGKTGMCLQLLRWRRSCMLQHDPRFLHAPLHFLLVGREVSFLAGARAGS